MRQKPSVFCLVVFGFLLAGLTATAPVRLWAADKPQQGKIKDLFDQGGRLGQFQNAEPVLRVKLTPSRVKPGDVVTLSVELVLPPDHYTYPLSAPSGSTTRIQILETKGLTPLPKDSHFEPDHPPKIVLDKILREKIYKHVGGATWKRQYRVTTKVGIQQVSFRGTIRYQVCTSEVCKPPKTIPISATAELVVGSSKRGKAAAAVSHPPSGKKSSGPKKKVSVYPFQYEGAPVRYGSKQEPVILKFGLSPANAKAGGEVTLRITIEMYAGWHTFAQSQNPENSGLPTRFRIKDLHGLEAIDSEFKADRSFTIAKDFEKKEQRTFHDQVTWSRRFRVVADRKEGAFGVNGTVRYQVCNEGQCRAPYRFTFALGQVSAPAKPLGKLVQPIPPAPRKKDSGIVAAGKKNENGKPEPKAQPAGIDISQGVVPFLIAAAAAGFLALLTPCVFPMIPITVSFFLKQGEKENHHPIGLATIYCLGIIVTFTALGLLMAVLFGPASLNKLANNPWLNLFIAAVLVFFGMNLLGLFEIRIPSSLLTWSSGKQAQGGVVGVLFMAITFTLVSFTCTFAFAGGLLVWASKGEYFWPILGMLAFSAAFSFPFFILALFPSLLKKMPKSGGWMNTVKVTMGMIEIGAVFKFLSVAELSWNPVPLIFDYPTVMSAWMVIAICTGMYLLGLFRLPHDTPSESISPIQLGFAMMFLSIAGYLGVGLYATEKPSGTAWEQIAAFAPPRFSHGGESGQPAVGAAVVNQLQNLKGDIGPTYTTHQGIQFALDYEKALKFAQENQRPVLFDFTGVNCVNCRQMEFLMAKPMLRKRLGNFVLVQLFADSVPSRSLSSDEREAIVKKNVALQTGWYGDATLPGYAIVTPDMKILARIVGRKSETVFAKFLDKGLKSWHDQNPRVAVSTLTRK